MRWIVTVVLAALVAFPFLAPEATYEHTVVLLALEFDLASLFNPCSRTNRHCLGVQLGATNARLIFEGCQERRCLNAQSTMCLALISWLNALIKSVAP